MRFWVEISLSLLLTLDTLWFNLDDTDSIVSNTTHIIT